MGTEPILVVAGAVLHTGQPVVANFIYSATDPLAVSMTLIAEEEIECGCLVEAQSTWVFGRDLLDVAISRTDMAPVGEGDVVATYLPAKDVLRLTLTDHEGKQWSLHVDAEPVYQFMEQSLAAIPAHAVTVDVDAAITQLLDGTWER